MRPCIGIPRLRVPPFCSYADLTRPGVTLADVERFHMALDELTERAEQNG